jgi:hypothetical protein
MHSRIANIHKIRRRYFSGNLFICRYRRWKHTKKIRTKSNDVQIAPVKNAFRNIKIYATAERLPKIRVLLRRSDENVGLVCAFFIILGKIIR